MHESNNVCSYDRIFMNILGNIQHPNENNYFHFVSKFSEKDDRFKLSYAYIPGALQKTQPKLPPNKISYS